MPRRPKEHQLEDKSITKFRSLLPESWVYRDVEKDYGIDSEVELFDKNGDSQALMFFAQLKATASDKDSEIMSVRLRIEVIEYYQELDLPVLLIRYSEKNDSILVKWMDKVDLYYAKKGAKTFNIKFINDDLWTPETSNKIEKKLKTRKMLKNGFITFPLSTSIIIEEDINSLDKSIIYFKLRKELKEYSNIIKISDNIEDSAISIKLNKKDLLIQVYDVKGVYFHGIKKLDEKYLIEEISKTILLGIALNMLPLKQYEMCANIIFENKLEEALLQFPKMSLKALPALLETSYLDKVVDLFSYSKDSKVKIILDAFLLQISSRGKNIQYVRKKHLNKKLKKFLNEKDDLGIGITYYNLGNLYHNNSNHSEAIAYYKKAIKYNPYYKKQFYYFQEIGGSYFMSNKFKEASKLYKKAIDLGAPNKTIALYADALLFSGSYKEALKQFNKYLEISEKKLAEFQLKAILLSEMLEIFKIEYQEINEIKADSILKNKKNANNIDKINEALGYNLLSNTAWFNAGILSSEQKDYRLAILSFLISGMIAPNDIEAWVNAFYLSFNLFLKNIPELLILGIQTAYHHNKEDYLEGIYLKALEYKIPQEEAKKILDFIEIVISDDSKEENKLTLRILNEKGIFENIFDMFKNK